MTEQSINLERLEDAISVFGSFDGKGEKYQTTAFPFPYWSGGLPWERAGVFTGLHA